MIKASRCFLAHRSLAKRTLVFILCLIAFLPPVFALRMNYSPSASVFGGGTFLHGTSAHLQTVQGKDAPVFRSSYSFGGDILAARVSFRKWALGAGISAMYTSDSLRAGNSFMQGYFGWGPSLEGEFFFGDRFRLAMKTRLMFCKNTMKYKFDVLDVEIVPSVKIKDVNSFRISLITPIDFTYRNESYSIRVHVGVSLQLMVGSRDWAKESGREAESRSVYDPVLSGGVR